MQNFFKYKLWPTSPKTVLGKTSETQIVFPSGRQCLTEALKMNGLDRRNRIAIPEWSSHCVTSAVAKFVTPIPLTEVVKYKIPVDVVLLYEQWGWPFVIDIDDRLASMSVSCIIYDRVDSADWNKERSVNKLEACFEVFSLSKLLGLPGGGLLRRKGRFTAFEDNSELSVLQNMISSSLNKKWKAWDFVVKSEIPCVPDALLQWLSLNDLWKALNIECVVRKKHLQMVLDSSLLNHHPTWMKQVAVDGASPGIVPLFPGRTYEIKKYQAVLIQKFGIESVIYNFNMSGDPFSPDYKQCLAFPIHGGVADCIVKVIDAIE
jgi:hypothetical protein